MGPGQVVLQESRSIVWISHVNRLLRCARENLRPVSMREFQDLKISQQSVDQEILSRRAQELERQLKERSGVFQFRDLSELEVDPMPASESPEESATDRVEGIQPEEEPFRRPSIVEHDIAAEVPIPDVNEPFPPTPESGYVPTTPPMESDQEGQENGNDNEMVEDHPEDVGVIYNASLVEPALDIDGDIVEDDNTIWQQHENPKEDYCEFAFLVPCNKSGSIEITLKKPLH